MRSKLLILITITILFFGSFSALEAATVPKSSLCGGWADLRNAGNDSITDLCAELDELDSDNPEDLERAAEINEQIERMGPLMRDIDQACQDYASQNASIQEYCNEFYTKTNHIEDDYSAQERVATLGQVLAQAALNQNLANTPEARDRLERLRSSARIAESNTKDPSADQCISWFSLNFGNCIKLLVPWILDWIIWGLSWVLWLANEIFNLALWFSIKNFSTFVGEVEGINIGWRIIRDLMNLAFIAGLFYIAIGTIIGQNKTDWKKMIPTLMIAALLINFSMLFARIMIDASNLLAVTFYDTLATPENQRAGRSPDIVSPLVQNMSLHRSEKITIGRPSEEMPEKSGLLQTTGKIIVTSAGKVIMIFIASFVLIVASILFIIRSIVLIFLLMLSPFAFIGMVLEKGKDLSGKWWGELNKQLLFAPAYMFCFFVTVKIVEGTRTMSNAFGSSESIGSVAMFFILVNGMLLGSIFVAQSIGVRGMKFATQKAGGLLAGVPAWFSQRTIGAAAANQARKTREKLQDRNLNPQERAKLEARAIRLEKVAKSTFDARNTDTVKGFAGVVGVDIGKGSTDSAAKRRDQLAKDAEENAKLLGPQSAGEKKEFEERAKGINRDIIDSQRGNLRQNTKDLDATRTRITDAIINDPDGEYQRQFGQNIGQSEADLELLKTEFANKERNFNDIKNGKLATPEQIAEAQTDLAQLAERKGAAETALNELKTKGNEYLDREIQKNAEVNKLMTERKDIIDRLNEVGDSTDEGFARAQESNKNLTRKTYNEDQKKKQKDYESGAWHKEKYAESLEAGLAGFGAGRPVPFTAAWTSKGRQEAVAGVRKHAKGKSKEQQVAELLKDDKDKGDDEKPSEGGKEGGGGEGKGGGENSSKK